MSECCIHCGNPPASGCPSDCESWTQATNAHEEAEKAFVRARATAAAERLVKASFKGRKGHGGADSSYRQMRAPELTALLIVAFEAGADWEAQR